MAEKIVVGIRSHGLRTDIKPFNLDNDSFPRLENAYSWRNQIKRKRGTQFLDRLTRYFNSTIKTYFTGATPSLNGSGIGNLLTDFSLEPNGSIVPGSVTITVGLNVYTDITEDGYLTPTGTGGVNLINYSSGQITIPAEAGNNYSAVFLYNPALPVMGAEDVTLQSNQFPGHMSFDTKYSYQVQTAFPYKSYDVSFYKNPVADPTNLPGYIPKTNSTSLHWNGQDYQQIWSTNYQNALWATNGITIPFTTTNIGMQFKPISDKPGMPGTGVVVTAAGPPAIADIHITAHGLVVGDFVFINEVQGITGINFQTGYVIAVIDADNITVEFPFAVLGGAYTSGGIAQYLTNNSDSTKDVLRWYDGDPTNGSATSPVLVQGKGWVNFMPPLSQGDFSISDLPADQYYLVGARMIINYKDRLLFIGPVIQSSKASPIYLQDTVIFSQNGSPYYTASFQGDPVDSTVTFSPVLVPTNQTGFPAAYFEDQTGFGGYIQAGFDGAITTAALNEDVLIMGFDNNIQTRFLDTNNSLIPFNFYIINSELGSTSTFSIINFDRSVFTRGERGYITTSQTQCTRVDLEILDEVFKIKLTNNGKERVTSQRDFINEWAYISFPDSSLPSNFPTKTLLYNYREENWAIFNETYTHYGQFRKQTGFTWATVGDIYPTWSDWNDPWDAGESTLLQPDIIAGNQQGFLLLRDEGTNEGFSLYIQNIVGNTVTSPNHSLIAGDFVIIDQALGTIGQQINGKIFQVTSVTQNTFQIYPNPLTGTYSGNGVMKRIYRPFIQTKQFPVAWDMGRKTRLGVQRYLLDKTDNAQMTLLIYLSQNADSPYNESPIIPELNSINDSLIYSTILYTCPESTNLGLTSANINLQTPTAQAQAQIWHRINTSLIGDTIQLGFTLSDTQLGQFSTTGQEFVITGATNANPCVLTCNNDLSSGVNGFMISISGVVGMTDLNYNPANYNIYRVISTTSTTITIDIDSTGFDPYISGGTLSVLEIRDQFAEIVLHGFILDVEPSQMLV